MKITTTLCPNGEYYAIDADEYDGAPDSGSPQGWGKTEWEAVADLAERFMEIEQSKRVYKRTQSLLEADPILAAASDEEKKKYAELLVQLPWGTL